MPPPASQDDAGSDDSLYPNCLIVLCHGVRADGSQLTKLRDAWRGIAPGAAFMFPDAPEPCPVSLSARLFGRATAKRQWFSLALPKADQIGAAKLAASALNIRVDAELTRLGLKAHAVLFCGFSQGAMVALLAGTMRHTAPRGIVAIAGALLAAEDGFAPSCRPPVLLIHGTADATVPSLRSEIAASRLRDAGLQVDLVLLPGQDHLIVAQSAPIAADFVAGAAA